MEEKICWACQYSKPISAFGKFARAKDGLEAKCRECIAHYQRWIRHRNALWIIDYFQSHPCVDCGEPDPCVLDFDHIRGHKLAGVKRLATSMHSSLNRIKEEISKCEVRCANCHRRITATRGNFHQYTTNPVAKPPWVNRNKPL